MKIDSIKPHKLNVFFPPFWTISHGNGETKNNHMFYLLDFHFLCILIEHDTVICVYSIKIDAIRLKDVHSIEYTLDVFVCAKMKIKIKFIF